MRRLLLPLIATFVCASGLAPDPDGAWIFENEMNDREHGNLVNVPRPRHEGHPGWRAARC